MKNFGWSGHKLQFHFSYNCSNTYFQTFWLSWLTCSETKPLLWLISFLLWFSPLWSWISPPLPHAYPLPSFYPSPIPALFVSGAHRPRPSPLSPLLASSFLSRPSVSALPSRGGSSDDSGDARPRAESGTASQETQASSSPLLSSSARWGEPNLSSVHPHQAGWQSQTHLLFTPLINYTQAKGALRGRRLQRTLSTCHPPTAAQRQIPALCAQPLSSMSSFSLWEQEAACHHAFSQCCYVRMSRMSSWG